MTLTIFGGTAYDSKIFHRVLRCTLLKAFGKSMKLILQRDVSLLDDVPSQLGDLVTSFRSVFQHFNWAHLSVTR